MDLHLIAVFLPAVLVTGHDGVYHQEHGVKSLVAPREGTLIRSSGVREASRLEAITPRLEAIARLGFHDLVAAASVLRMVDRAPWMVSISPLEVIRGVH